MPFDAHRPVCRMEEDVSIKRASNTDRKIAGYQEQKLEPEHEQGHAGECGRLQVELDSALLFELLTKHAVCAADLRCLNRRSKLLLKAICLDVCTKRRD